MQNSLEIFIMNLLYYKQSTWAWAPSLLRHVGALTLAPWSMKSVQFYFAFLAFFSVAFSFVLDEDAFAFSFSSLAGKLFLQLTGFLLNIGQSGVQSYASGCRKTKIHKGVTKY